MRLPHITPFAKAPLIFFTACASDRRPVLANQAAFATIGDVWRKSGQLDGWYVGRFVFMPDHVHFFAKPVAEAKPMGRWNKMWKSVTARVLARKLNLSPPIWQGDTFDHILCSPESYEEKWKYVRENPVRAGLCHNADEWPWQREINNLSF